MLHAFYHFVCEVPKKEKKEQEELAKKAEEEEKEVEKPAEAPKEEEKKAEKPVPETAEEESVTEAAEKLSLSTPKVYLIFNF